MKTGDDNHDRGASIELHLHIRVAPGRRDDFFAFLRDAIPFYERPGGIRIRLLQMRDEPDCFIEVVEYRDREAYEQDQKRVESDPDMKATLSRWRALLAEPVQVVAYDVHPLESIVAREAP